MVDLNRNCLLTLCGLVMPYSIMELTRIVTGNGLLPDGTKPLPGQYHQSENGNKQCGSVSGNGLLPDGTKPLPKTMSAK